MRQKGTIRELHDDHIVVGCGTTGGCQSCSSVFCSEKEGEDESVFQVSNPKGIDLNIGDDVEIFLDPRRTIAAGFLVLILPLILFGAGFLIASRYTDLELVQALVGILGLGVGFFIGYLRKKASGDRDLPEIVSVASSKVMQESVR